MHVKFYKPVFFLFLFFAVLSGTAHPEPAYPQFAASFDGVPISYEIHGSGNKTIVLIHAWCCDARYWKYQVRYLESKYRIITLDLAGHGHSGMERTNYTVEAFGEDVAAVVRKACRGKVVLAGHSIGGPVAVETAKILGDRVIGIVGVDNFVDVSRKITDGAMNTRLSSLKKDFRNESRKFVDYMLTPKPDKATGDWIMYDMSSAPENVALSALENLFLQFKTGYAADVFKEVRLPVVTVNGDLRPVNVQANRKHMLYFDSIIMKNSNHFLNLSNPDAFNPNFEKAIKMVYDYAGS